MISDILTSVPTDERVPLETETYKVLTKLNIPFERVDNDPVHTMEECIEIEKKLGVEIRKSIFLCNKKKTTFFLVIVPANKQVDTKDICSKLGISSLSFASAEYMVKYLGTTPGSATIMGILNDFDDYVQVIMDEEVVDSEYFGCNPGINTTHLKIKTEDLLKKFLPHTRHKAKIVKL